MTFYSPHLYRNVRLGFFCLLFLPNLICNIFSLFIDIILSTSLLTELDISRLGIYITLQHFIKLFTGAPM